MEQYLPYIWLIIIVVAAVVEGLTSQLVSIWFVAGAICALIANICGAPVWIQIDVFALVTILTLLATRPLVKKLLNFKRIDTNAGRYIGETGIVTTEINNILGQGQVTVRGSVWTARSIDNSQIEVGSQVLVKSIEGVKLMVELIDPKGE